jgi:hypothetical protein
MTHSVANGDGITADGYERHDPEQTNALRGGEFTEETFEEFETVRASGACNMLDRSCVGAQAEARNLLKLESATWDRRTYSRLLTAFSAWKEAQE